MCQRCEAYILRRKAKEVYRDKEGHPWIVPYEALNQKGRKRFEAEKLGFKATIMSEKGKAVYCVLDPAHLKMEEGLPTPLGKVVKDRELKWAIQLKPGFVTEDGKWSRNWKEVPPKAGDISEEGRGPIENGYWSQEKGRGLIDQIPDEGEFRTLRAQISALFEIAKAFGIGAEAKEVKRSIGGVNAILMSNSTIGITFWAENWFGPEEEISKKTRAMLEERYQRAGFDRLEDIVVLQVVGIPRTKGGLLELIQRSKARGLDVSSLEDLENTPLWRRCFNPQKGELIPKTFSFENAIDGEFWTLVFNHSYYGTLKSKGGLSKLDRIARKAGGMAMHAGLTVHIIPLEEIGLDEATLRERIESGELPGGEIIDWYGKRSLKIGCCILGKTGGGKTTGVMISGLLRDDGEPFGVKGYGVNEDFGVFFVEEGNGRKVVYGYPLEKAVYARYNIIDLVEDEGIRQKLRETKPLENLVADLTLQPAGAFNSRILTLFDEEVPLPYRNDEPIHVASFIIQMELGSQLLKAHDGSLSIITPSGKVVRGDKKEGDDPPTSMFVYEPGGGKTSALFFFFGDHAEPELNVYADFPNGALVRNHCIGVKGERAFLAKDDIALSGGDPEVGRKLLEMPWEEIEQAYKSWDFKKLGTGDAERGRVIHAKFPLDRLRRAYEEGDVVTLSGGNLEEGRRLYREIEERLTILREMFTIAPVRVMTLHGVIRNAKKVREVLADPHGRHEETLDDFLKRMP